MTQDVAFYLIVLALLNFGGPLLAYRKSRRWDLILLTGGFLWFIEAYLIAQLFHGTGYDPMIKAIGLSTYVPIPFILGIVGAAMLMFKQFKGGFITTEVNDGRYSG